MVLNTLLVAGRFWLLDGEGVDGGLEGVVENLAGVGFREIAEDDRVFEVHRRGGEQPVAHEVAHLRIENLIAADEPEVFQQLPREEADHRAVVGDAGAIERDGVMHLGVEHGLEDDLARLLRRERFERERAIAEGRRVEGGEILELTLIAASEPGQRDVEHVDILGFVFDVHFHDERFVAFRALAHRHAFEGDALALDGLDEIHERRRAHDGHRLADDIVAEIHPAQTAAERLLRKNVTLRGVGPQADDGGDVADIPALLEHKDGNDGLVRRLEGVDFVGLFAEPFEFLLVLAGGGFGNLAVVLGVNDKDGALQLGADFFEIGADVVAVAGVVHHDKEDRLFAEGPVFGVALAPLLNAELQVVVVFLGEEGALLFAEFGAAGDIWQDGMLDDVLVDGLDERIVGNGLDEDGTVVVARGGGHIDLQREAAILLEHLVVDVLDGFEPRHAGIVDVVCLVVEDGEFLDLADDFAEVGLAVGGLAGGLFPEGVGEKVIAQVVVLQ
jgi:hypothetical protein